MDVAAEVEYSDMAEALESFVSLAFIWSFSSGRSFFVDAATLSSSPLRFFGADLSSPELIAVNLCLDSNVQWTRRVCSEIGVPLCGTLAVIADALVRCRDFGAGDCQWTPRQKAIFTLTVES